jgi:type I restriction enzyme M protein
VVDPAQYKDYILVMLFLKYISDVWRDHYQAYQQQYGNDEERIRRRLDRERFVLPQGSSFYDLYEQRNTPNIGELINEALDAIEEANKVKLEGVFRNIDFNSEANLGKTKDRNRRLKHLLEDFAKPQLDMRPSRVSEDVIGNTYIYLIERFASDAGKKAGEFYTPHKVSELLAKLVQPWPGDRICDPACGSGGLLTEAAREVGSQDFALFGMEVNGSTWTLSRMNMFLHGMDAADIRWCDTIQRPELIEDDELMKFNIVVANPPFSLKKWGKENAKDDEFNRFHRGVPPKSRGDYAFIQHMIEVAYEDKGKVGVIVPHGVLFRSGSEGKIRKKLIQENLLEAVIGLPENLFFGTGIPAAILIFNKGKEHNNVLFIDASEEFEKGTKQNKLRDQDIEKIVFAFRDFEKKEKFSYVADPEEIKENNHNLNIPRYVDTFEPEPEVDLEEVQKEINGLEQELSKVQEKMNQYLEELELN